MDVLDRSVASKGHPITAPSLASVAEVREPLDRLLAYCARHDWAGYDPYDALNSRVFNATPFARNRYCRIAITQFLKRLPINLRVPLQVPRRQNPKGLALFLSAAIRLDRAGALADPTLIGRLADRLVATRSTGTRYWCWGYCFPWQTRTVVVPVGAPNLVCTAFVADALLDLFQANGDRRHLEMAVSAAEYLLNDLYWQDGNVAGFSYPLPRLRTQVHNANLLAAAVLCRVAAETGARQLVDPALRAARHSAAAQAPDGSWDYGQSSTQKWVDNFHTGFNLGALQSLGRSLKSDEFEPNVRAGFEYYRTRFFDDRGWPKYFHNKLYPIDVHCVAQSIITLLELGQRGDGSVEQAHRVFRFAMEQLWDRRGYFYYRVLPLMTNRIPYMRWCEAWMALALSVLLEHVTGTARAQGGAS